MCAATLVARRRFAAALWWRRNDDDDADDDKGEAATRRELDELMLLDSKRAPLGAGCVVVSKALFVARAVPQRGQRVLFEMFKFKHCTHVHDMGSALYEPLAERARAADSEVLELTLARAAALPRRRSSALRLSRDAAAVALRRELSEVALLMFALLVTARARLSCLYKAKSTLISTHRQKQPTKNTTGIIKFGAESSSLAAALAAAMALSLLTLLAPGDAAVALLNGVGAVVGASVYGAQPLMATPHGSYTSLA